MAQEFEDISILSNETERLKSDLADLDRLGQSFGNTLTRAFASAVIDGRKLSDVLRSLALSLSSQALSAALRPLGNALGARSAAPFPSPRAASYRARPSFHSRAAPESWARRGPKRSCHWRAVATGDWAWRLKAAAR